jgi:hypothetical protein
MGSQPSSDFIKWISTLIQLDRSSGNTDLNKQFPYTPGENKLFKAGTVLYLAFSDILLKVVLNTITITR